VDSWTVLAIMFWVTVASVAVLLALPLVLRVILALRRASQITKAPRLASEVIVVNKRTEIPTARANQEHYVTFQFSDGQRVELNVLGSQSGMLSVGDQGTLDWQGSRFHGFTREILR